MGGGSKLQKNKAHKTKHATAGALDSRRKGKYVPERPPGGKAGPGGGGSSKAERLMQAKQAQKAKRGALLDARRTGESPGGLAGLRRGPGKGGLLEG